MLHEPVHKLLAQDKARLDGNTNLPSPWRNKLVVVGSSALANDLTDRGATPLRSDTVLVSKHWNVANSIIMNRFVRRSGFLTETGLIVLLSVLSAVLTWRFRALLASFLVAAVLALAGGAAAGAGVGVREIGAQGDSAGIPEQTRPRDGRGGGRQQEAAGESGQGNVADPSPVSRWGRFADPLASLLLPDLGERSAWNHR